MLQLHATDFKPHSARWPLTTAPSNELWLTDTARRSIIRVAAKAVRHPVRPPPFYSRAGVSPTLAACRPSTASKQPRSIAPSARPVRAAKPSHTKSTLSENQPSLRLSALSEKQSRNVRRSGRSSTPAHR